MQDLLGGRIDFMCEQISTAFRRREGYCDAWPGPATGIAGSADRAGAGPARSRLQHLERLRVSQRNARSYRPPACGGDDRGRGYPPGARTLRQRRRDCRSARAAQSRISREVHSPRAREMGGSDCCERGDRGLTARPAHGCRQSYPAKHSLLRCWSSGIGTRTFRNVRYPVAVGCKANLTCRRRPAAERARQPCHYLTQHEPF
jgi:hypothetical protein